MRFFHQIFNQNSTKYLIKYLSALLLQYHIFIKERQKQKMNPQIFRIIDSLYKPFLLQEDKLKELRIKCIENNQAFYLCTNEKCKEKSIFTCANKDCKCQLGHGLCLTAKVKILIQAIERKTLQTEDIKRFINLSFDRMIDQLSQLRQKYLLEIETKLKFTYQSQIQKQFLKVVYGQQQKLKQFNNKDSALLFKVVTYKEISINNLFNDAKEVVTKILGQLSNYAQQNIKVFNNQMISTVNKELTIQRRRAIKLKNSLQLSKLQLTANEQNLIPIMIKYSSIMTPEYASRLFRFFPQPINNISLIFKKNNKTPVKQFYQLCRSASNTIILCKTKGNKIVGGYTPLKYYKQNLQGENIPIQDLLEESFMFSLTNNDKFYLEDKYHAIQLGVKNEAICFGSKQIYITDARMYYQDNPYCTINFNGSYRNQKYIKRDKQTYIKLIGQESNSCQLIDFQVWKVQMQK